MAAMTAAPPSASLQHGPALSRPIHPPSINGRRPGSAASSFDGASHADSPSGPPPTHPLPPSAKSHMHQFYVNGGTERASTTMSPVKAPIHMPMHGDPHHPHMASVSPVYSAHYSGIHVYEMTVNNIAVMRRRVDSWLNATQILKVAGVEKGRRMKILEREILTGEHEKVQGGYGKYQGTWIQWSRGLAFCHQYNVAELLKPLLEYDMVHDGSTTRGELLNTPTKEQAMAAHRKMQYNLDHSRKPGPLFKSLSSEASQAVYAMNQIRNQSANSNHSSFSSNHGGSQPGSQSTMPNGSQESAVYNLSQQSQMSNDSTNSFRSARSNDADSFSQLTPKPFDRSADDGTADEPPRKRIKASQEDTNADLDLSQKSSVDSIMTDSFQSQDTAITAPSSVSLSQNSAPQPQPPVRPAQSPDEDRQVQNLRSLFFNGQESQTELEEALARLPLPEIDYPMDKRANAALSWAATMGNIPLTKALIKRGASIFRVNDAGETALMRACSSVNNYDRQTFLQLLEVLSPTIEMRDTEQRSILHHITLTSAIQARSSASRYYLETLLEFVVRQGSPPNSFDSQQTIKSDTTAALDAEPSTSKVISLARLQSELLDAKDSKGDTALNMAARTGNKVIIEQLLEIGANSRIPNKSQLRPIDFGVDIGMLDADGDTTLVGDDSKEDIAVGAARDAQSSFSRVLQEHTQKFSAELALQHQQLDSTRARIRSTSYQIADLTRKIETQRVMHRDRSQRKIKIANLRRATEEMRTRRLSRESQSRTQPGTSKTYSDLQIDTENLPGTDQTVTDGARVYLSTLPKTSELKARVDSHKALHLKTDTELRKLDLKSMDREKAYRKILALSMGCEEDEVDALVPRINKALKGEMNEATGEGNRASKLMELLSDLGSTRSDTPRSLT